MSFCILSCICDLPQTTKERNLRYMLSAETHG